jgi:pepsin A
MSYQGLVAKQTVGSAIGDSILPHQGIVGFSGQFAAQFPTNSTSFFQSLCNQQQVTQSRFGLALTSNGTGTQILGELDSSLYSGDLTVVPVLEEWVVSGDIAINGTVLARDLVVELDSGTATVVG